MKTRALALAYILLPAVEAAHLSPLLAANASAYQFDLPAGPVSASLSDFSRVTGISIGWANGAPEFRVPAVKGRMGADEALARLFAGTGWHAIRVGGNGYRIERVPHAPWVVPRPQTAPPRNVEPISARPASAPDIIVTAQKRPQPLQQVAMSISVVALDTAGGLTAGSRDLALQVDGLALTNLGPGRNRQFIRGVADSPFNGPSQSTVAVQLDEARITFDAPDPDIRLLDMQRVEILKGPQGPLYGSGALGGIYHLVTRKPDLTDVSGSARILVEAVQGGQMGEGAEAVLNLPLQDDRVGIRAAGYMLRSGGWIDNIGARRNANGASTAGLRLAARWQPDPDWTIDVSGMLQDVNAKDSQYVIVSDHTLRRAFAMAEPTDNDFKVGAATIQGRLGGLNLLATTSYVRHGVNSTLDSSDASAAFGLSGTSTFVDDRKYRIINHEIRLSPANAGRWLVGLSYMHAKTHTGGTISTPTATLAVESLDRAVREISLFAEATIPIFSRLSATAGARLFRTATEDETLEESGGLEANRTETMLSPSLSFNWAFNRHANVYLRYARASRPGGIALTGETGPRLFDLDELGTIDLGIRYQAAETLSLSGSLFSTTWYQIQSDYLLANGLVSTRNAGKGIIRGAEASSEWEPLTGLKLSAGASYVDALLVKAEDGLHLEDSRLPVTPNVTARLTAQYRFALGDWQSVIVAQANYVGSARLSFDQDLDRKMGHYAVASSALRLSRGRTTIGAGIDNIFNVRGDTFAFGNPFSIRTVRQFTPLRPRTLTLSIARRW